MRQKKLFLNWLLRLSLIIAGICVMAILGWFKQIYALDFTKLSFAIMAIFFAATVWCGMLTWRADKLAEKNRDANSNRGKSLKNLENGMEHGWLAAGLCEKLGITGTVFGLVTMLINGFIDFQGDHQATQGLLYKLSSGMSTAFITTLVGVICGILLSVQYHLLTAALEKIKL